MNCVAILTKKPTDYDDEQVKFVYGLFKSKEDAEEFIERNDYRMTHLWDIDIIAIQEPY